MSTSVEFYQKQAQDALSAIPWLAQMQTSAIDQLAHSGFPNRHDEEWKYTTVDNWVQQNFIEANNIARSTSPVESDLPFLVEASINNGQLKIMQDVVSQLPKGVLVLPLAQALSEHAQLIKPYLGSSIQPNHGFHYLNAAMIHLGVFIYIPAGVKIEEPIVLSHFQDQDNHSVHLRHVVVAEKESHVTLIEEYLGQDDTCYFTNTITEIALGENAQCTHYKIQREGKAACHIGHVAVNQSAHSAFASHSLSLGGKLVRSDLSINLQQQYAQCLMNGIYIPNEGQHIDHHTTVNHLVPDCSSKQDYKGILNGHARAVFNGKVVVAKDAQHTDASQQNKNLLLSANAEVDTKPQLEIFADDVVCSHGATVGQLDEDALFYLATRGIDRMEASRYLVHAFTEENLRLIPQEKLATWFGTLITQQVG